ncbi:hypothetical protein KKH3_06770 [Pectobacterium actinidiae]|nr:hypothetical protein KKH3_06770 [Pectobacterium actinidiae]
MSIKRYFCLFFGIGEFLALSFGGEQVLKTVFLKVRSY